MIPQGWEQAPLGELFEFKNGLNGEKSLYGTGVKFANVMDVFRGPRLMQADITGSMQVTDRQLQEYGLARGDVLFNRTSETDDEIAMASVFMDDQPAVFGGFVIRARPLGNRLTPDFCTYAFQINDIRRELIKRGQGAVRANIGQKDLAEVLIKFPPPREQRQIASALEPWVRAIKTVEALIANARTQKQALMQQLLSGKRRLPGFSEPWAWADFADVFGRVKTKNAEGKTNVLTISAQHGLISQVEYFNKSVASDDVRGYTLLQRGDFAYNKSYSDGYPMGAIKPLDRYDSGIVSSLYICFRLTGRGFDHDFFRHYFEAGLFNREISAIAQEGARNHGLLNVSVVEFFETSLHVPQPDEQAAIAKVINAAEAKEQAYQAQLTVLRLEKTALMQQLLTGKRRVKLPESEVA